MIVHYNRPWIARIFDQVRIAIAALVITGRPDAAAVVVVRPGGHLTCSEMVSNHCLVADGGRPIRFAEPAVKGPLGYIGWMGDSAPPAAWMDKA